MSDLDKELAQFEAVKARGLHHSDRLSQMRHSDHLAQLREITASLDEFELALDTDPLNAREKPLDLFPKFCWRCGGRIKRRRAQPVHKFERIARFAGQQGRQGHQDNIRGRSVRLSTGKFGDCAQGVCLSAFDRIQSLSKLAKKIFHRLLSRWWSKREKVESGAGESPLPPCANGKTAPTEEAAA